MANSTGSFGLGITFTVSSSGVKTTSSGFNLGFAYDSKFAGGSNALTLSVDSPGTFTLNADTPGTLGP